MIKYIKFGANTFTIPEGQTPESIIEYLNVDINKYIMERDDEEETIYIRTKSGTKGCYDYYDDYYDDDGELVEHAPKVRKEIRLVDGQFVEVEPEVDLESRFSELTKSQGVTVPGTGTFHVIDGVIVFDSRR